jgi:hypothetical protein
MDKIFPLTGSMNHNGTIPEDKVRVLREINGFFKQVEEEIRIGGAEEGDTVTKVMQAIPMLFESSEKTEYKDGRTDYVFSEDGEAFRTEEMHSDKLAFNLQTK